MAYKLREIGNISGNVSQQALKAVGDAMGKVVDLAENFASENTGKIAKSAFKALGASETAVKHAETTGKIIGGVAVGLATGNAIGSAITGLAIANGVVSTGTAISALSGAAQNAAALANIGNGSMAAGQAVLTGINVASTATGIASVTVDEKKKNIRLESYLSDEKEKNISLETELEKCKSKQEELYTVIKQSGRSELLKNAKEISDRIYNLASASKSSINLSIFTINEYNLLDMLIKKAGEGIKVKIVTDYDNLHKMLNNISYSNTSGASGRGGTSFNTAERIKRCFKHDNIEVKVWGLQKKGAIMHKKNYF